jgi:C4-dicarboxylate transporter DctM subunit
MDPIWLGVFAIIGMLLFAAFGVPIGFAVGMFGALGLWLSGGFNLMAMMATTIPYEFVNNYVYVVLPMFILMGSVAAKTGIITDMYAAAHSWSSTIRGGLLHATMVAAAMFGAVSGSTNVSAALFTKIALPEMDRANYNKAIAAGAICSAGILAAFIPPSLSAVIYAFLTGESIGQLLIAGLGPGLVITAAFMVCISLIVWIKPDVAPLQPERVSLSERLLSIMRLWPMVILVILVLGGMYAGWFAPSAAGSIGAIGVMLIGVVKRKTNFKMLSDSLRETATLTSVIMVVILGGMLFARFLTASGFLSELVDGLKAYGLSKWVFLTAVGILYLLLGMVIDTLSIWLISVPVLHPLALSMGLDPMWFYIFVLHLSGMGCITPPVGMNLFAVLAACEGRITATQLYVGVYPFVVAELVVLVLIFIFPEIATWLPHRMRM